MLSTRDKRLIIVSSQLKVVSDSPGLVDFAIGLVIFLFNLPDGQVLFFGRKFKLQKKCNQSCQSKRVLGLVEMTCGLVHATTSCQNVETLPRKNDLSCCKLLLVTGL